MVSLKRALPVAIVALSLFLWAGTWTLLEQQEKEKRNGFLSTANNDGDAFIAGILSWNDQQQLPQQQQQQQRSINDGDDARDPGWPPPPPPPPPGGDSTLNGSGGAVDAVPPNGTDGGSGNGSLRAFLLDDEDYYCNAPSSYRNDPSAFRCLVPRHPGAQRAYVASVPLDDARRAVANRTAFHMFPLPSSSSSSSCKNGRWLGRTFNNLKQVYSAIVAGRACGRMVLLPRWIRYDDNFGDDVVVVGGGGGGGGGDGGNSGEKGHENNRRQERRWSRQQRQPSSYFDCVDFRDAPVPDPFPRYDRLAYCNITPVLEEVECSRNGLGRGGSGGGVLGDKSVSYYWHRLRDFVAFPIVSDDYFDSARLEAKRAVLAYWGMRPGSYRCRPCRGDNDGGLGHDNATDSDGAIKQEGVSTRGIRRRKPVHALAYVRGEDLFLTKGARVAHKGQPPLDFYVKAIRHSGATVVTLVSSDYLNPVVNALRRYNWTEDAFAASSSTSTTSPLPPSNETGEGKEEVKTEAIREFAPVRIVTKVGGPYDDVVHRIFCARILILGHTSMNPLAAFSPNVRSVYLGRLRTNVAYEGSGGAAEERRRDDNDDDDDDGDVGISSPGSNSSENRWSIPNERSLLSLFARITNETKVYGYVTRANYTPYSRWVNSPEQRVEMTRCNDGEIIPLN